MSVLPNDPIGLSSRETYCVLYNAHDRSIAEGCLVEILEQVQDKHQWDKAVPVSVSQRPLHNAAPGANYLL